MLTKRILITLSFSEGILIRTKKFQSDYRYTSNFIGNKNIDEIIIIDVSKNKKKRKKFLDSVRKISQNCFVPITVGGYISDLDEIKILQMCGADKIIINSLIYQNPDNVAEITKKYGSQFVVGGIDYKFEKGKYYLFKDHGKNKTNISIYNTLKLFEKLGVGEIMLQSIDKDGSLSGLDIEFSKIVKKNTFLPLISNGSIGKWEHFYEGFKKGKLDAISTNNIYHFTDSSIAAAKNYLLKKNILLRR
jgi:cyclase